MPQATIKDVVKHKREILERYRSARMEEMLEELRAEAEREREVGLIPWKGEFRSREDVLYWYGQRKRWDRRFLLDTGLAVVAIVALFKVGQLLIRTLMPEVNFPGA